MDKNSTLIIEKVGNGFIASERHDIHVCAPASSTMVFNELPQLYKFLKAHFGDEKEKQDS